MATYLCLFEYGPQAWQGLVGRPEDRGPVLDATFQGLGGRLVALHYILGPYDGMVIGELPDPVGAAAVTALVKSTGAYARVETYALLSPTELVAALGRAGEAAAQFVPAGSRR